MKTMRPPLTTNAFGSTRCPGCEKRFTDTPDLPVTDVEATEAYTRKGSVSLGESLQVTRRWHPVCLEATNAWIAKVREDARQQQAEDIRQIAISAGLDPEPYVAKFLAQGDQS